MYGRPASLVIGSQVNCPSAHSLCSKCSDMFDLIYTVSSTRTTGLNGLLETP
jgi:hypothetical protein